MLAIGFIVLYQIEAATFYYWLAENFYYVDVLHFVECFFFCISEIIICFFFFINMTNDIDFYHFVKLTAFLRQTLLVIMYYSLFILLDSICSYFVKNFTSLFMRDIGLSFSSRNVFVRFSIRVS